MNPFRVCSVQVRLVGSTILAALSVASINFALPAPALAAPAPSVAPVTAAALDDPEGGYGRLMLVLDSSGSMSEPAGGGDTKIAAAKSALSTLVNDLPDEAEVGLRVFGAEVFSRTDAGSCEDTQQIVEPSTDNREELLERVCQ
ncbi:MAG: VWA domain-containing protein [Nocardioidaceae bacterium]|nr:VWA domain-containing protein [Nocardioidaceae bacterium]